MTKGLILSGGWGTRLRPLTCTVPKTLIPVLNTPIIERQINLLKEAGVEEIVLAVSVMSEDLKRYFKKGKKLGIKINYTKEERPMGTAGALKLAEPFLKDENFFMLNGDVILNFDFKDLLKAHNKFGGIGTIASRLIDNPERYGVLITDEKTQRIERFLEKDEFDQVENKKTSMPINAGVYLLEPEIFSFIPPRKKVSIERDTFPKVAKTGKFYHQPISGLWKDIGKPYELLRGNILLMEEILEKDANKSNLIEESADIHPTVKIIPPVNISKNTIIKENCTIGPNAIIGNDVYIEKNCQLKESLIYEESYFSENSYVSNAIIADNCFICKGVKIKGNEENLVILASHVEIKDNIQLICPPNDCISICHHEKIRESIKK